MSRNGYFFFLVLIFGLLNQYTESLRHQILGYGLLADILSRKLQDIGESDIEIVDLYNTSTFISNSVIPQDFMTSSEFSESIHNQLIESTLSNVDAEFLKPQFYSALNFSFERNVSKWAILNFQNLPSTVSHRTQRSSIYTHEWRFEVPPNILNHESYVSAEFCRLHLDGILSYPSNFRVGNISVFYDEPGLSFCRSFPNSEKGTAYFPSIFSDPSIFLNISKIRPSNYHWYVNPFFANWDNGTTELSSAIQVIEFAVEKYRQNSQNPSPDNFIIIVVSIMAFAIFVFAVFLGITTILNRRRSNVDIPVSTARD